jgi:hypothetical protein
VSESPLVVLKGSMGCRGERRLLAEWTISDTICWLRNVMNALAAPDKLAPFLWTALELTPTSETDAIEQLHRRVPPTGPRFFLSIGRPLKQVAADLGVSNNSLRFSRNRALGGGSQCKAEPAAYLADVLARLSACLSNPEAIHSLQTLHGKLRQVNACGTPSGSFGHKPAVNLHFSRGGRRQATPLRSAVFQPVDATLGQEKAAALHASALLTLKSLRDRRALSWLPPMGRFQSCGDLLR